MANTLRIKRRTTGNAGAPASLKNAELAYNEVDDVLYYGRGAETNGDAVTIPAIAGPGAYTTLATAQTISGNKTFTGTVTVTDATISGLSSSSVTEGTNLYFTTARARESVSGNSASGISYDSSTGVIALASVPNTALANSTITINGVATPLGGSTTTTAVSGDLGDTITLSGTAGEVEISTNAETGTFTFGLPDTVQITTDLTVGNNLVVTGDLTVNGTQTILNTQTLAVEDKNLELGKVESPTDTTADGGGITLLGGTNKTLLWLDATDAWTSSEHLDLASGKVYRIGGTDVLSGSSLGTGVTGSSLTSVGTLTSGTWQATTIAVAHGGTGATDAATARTNLGVAIGTDVQAWDADLDTLSGMQTGAATALALLTSTEVAVIDGSTAAVATTLAATDTFVVNDAGTMVQVALSDLVTFLENETASGFDLDGGTF